MDAQMQIRENTLELHEFLKDLKGWEDTVKEKEKKIKSKSTLNERNGNIPAPRKNSTSVVEDTVKGSDTKKTGQERRKVGVTKVKKKETTQDSVKTDSTAASHTYDYFRDKWDKYDVDAALRELDEESEDEGAEVLEERDKVIPPVRGIQPKRSKTGEETTSRAQVMEPGKLFGGGFGAVDRVSNHDDGAPSANSERELGNDFYKEGKYVKAIECYSRSIALQPTAAAHANRAMASLKLRKYEEAEEDCSEAISLDDRYTKAYARRGTARRELKKLLLAVEDFEFALRLEPDNKELKKQYTEARENYEQTTGSRPSDKKRTLDVKEAVKDSKASAKASVSLNMNSSVTSSKPFEKLGDSTKNNLEQGTAGVTTPARRSDAKGELKAPESPIQVLSPPNRPSATQQSRTSQIKSSKKPLDQEVIQKAAARAAATSALSALREFAVPRNAYEFEAVWKGFEGNRDGQSRLIKLMDPASLPQVFKNNLGASMLVEIILCLEVLFPDDASFAVQVLENLTKVGRFTMTVMFLTAKDKQELARFWDEMSMIASPEVQQTLKDLRVVYRF